MVFVLVFVVVLGVEVTLIRTFSSVNVETEAPQMDKHVMELTTTGVFHVGFAGALTALTGVVDGAGAVVIARGAVRLE